MKTERAIELLHRLQDEQFDGIHGDERREALNMAVRALEGDGDTISRQAAIMAVKTGALSAATIFGRTDEGATAYYETVKAIKALPSAQPQAIRCKDCKYGDWYDDISGHRRCYCTMHGCGGFKAEDFCSRGKADGGESE